MPELIQLTIDGQAVDVAPGTTVAAAILNRGRYGFRRSVGDQDRGPLCGMGICFECRVSIDGQPHIKSCTVLCQPGMDVCTGGGR